MKLEERFVKTGLIKLAGRVPRALTNFAALGIGIITGQFLVRNGNMPPSVIIILLVLGITCMIYSALTWTAIFLNRKIEMRAAEKLLRDMHIWELP